MELETIRTGRPGMRPAKPADRPLVYDLEDAGARGNRDSPAK
jgi:hypothetical protein